MNRLPTGWIRWLTVRVASNIDRLTRKPRLVSAIGPPIAVAGSATGHQLHDFALSFADAIGWFRGALRVRGRAGADRGDGAQRPR